MANGHFRGGIATLRGRSTAFRVEEGRIYPDFIFAVQPEGQNARVTVLETKGDQLDNLDTAYKREVLSYLSDHYSWDDVVPAGELELVKNSGRLFEGHWF
jgi:type III restriction enzyme